MDRGPAGQRGESWSDGVGRRASQSPLHVTFHREPATLQLAGVIDDSTYPVLTQSLARAALSGATALRIDLAGIEFCDLAGLRAMTSLANPGGQGPGIFRQVTIAHLPAQLTGIIRILGWDTIPGLVLVDPAAELG